MIRRQSTITRLNSNGYSISIHDVLMALSTVKRMEILTALSIFRSLSVSEIAAALQYEVSDVCKNVRSLRDVKLITGTVFKKEHLQQLAPAIKGNMRGGIVRLSIHIDQDIAISLSFSPRPFLLRRLAEYNQYQVTSNKRVHIRGLVEIQV